MFRKILVIALVLQLAVPPFAGAEGEEAAPAEQNRTTEKLIWGALSVLNFALVTSSFVNLQFYGDRANELEEVGLDADPFWDASNREKIVLGISTLSFVFTLAAWKKSFDSPSIAATPVPKPQTPRFLDEREEEPEPIDETTALLAFDSRVRYDTLFSGSGQPDPTKVEDKVLDLSVNTRVDTVFPDEEPVPAGLTDEEKAAQPPVADVLVAEEVPVGNAIAAQQEAVAVETESVEIPDAPQGEQELPVVDSDPVAELLASKLASESPRSDIADVSGSSSAHSAIVPVPEATLEPETLVTTLDLPEPAGDTASFPFEVMPYAVHVSSFRSMEQAQVDEERWAKRGFLVLVEEAEVKGATWYRVQVGNFPSRTEARREAMRIQEEYRHDFARVTKRQGF